MKAAITLAKYGFASQGIGQLLPNLKDIKNVNYDIAVEVAKQAIADKVTHHDSSTNVEEIVKHNQWKPKL